MFYTNYIFLIKSQNPAESFYDFIMEKERRKNRNYAGKDSVNFFLIYIFNYINCD